MLSTTVSPNQSFMFDSSERSEGFFNHATGAALSAVSNPFAVTGRNDTGSFSYLKRLSMLQSVRSGFFGKDGIIKRWFGVGKSTTDIVKDDLNINKSSDPFDFDTDQAWLSHAKADVYAARFLRYYVKLSDAQIESLKIHSESWQILREWSKFTPLYIEHYQEQIAKTETKKNSTMLKLFAEGFLVTAVMAAMGYGAVQAYQKYDIQLSEIGAVLGPIIAFAGIYHSGSGRFSSYRASILKYETDISAYDRARTHLLSLFFSLKDKILHIQQYGGDFVNENGQLNDDFKKYLEELTAEAKVTREEEINSRQNRDEKILNLITSGIRPIG